MKNELRKENRICYLKLHYYVIRINYFISKYLHICEIRTINYIENNNQVSK